MSSAIDFNVDSYSVYEIFDMFHLNSSNCSAEEADECAHRLAGSLANHPDAALFIHQCREKIGQFIASRVKPYNKSIISQNNDYDSTKQGTLNTLALNYSTHPTNYDAFHRESAVHDGGSSTYAKRNIAEVTNTFREMKPYFLGLETRSVPSDLSTLNSQLSTGGAAAFHLRTPKHFYVSPFSDVDTAFDFTLRSPSERLSIQIDDYVGASRTLTSTLAGPRRELTGARLAWFSLKYPAITLRIITLIHWHAAVLWFRRLPWFAKAARAADQRDLYRPHPSIAHSAPALGAKLPVSTEAA
jgi:hypothetical protein